MENFQQVFANQLQQAEYKHPTSDGDWSLFTMHSTGLFYVESPIGQREAFDTVEEAAFYLLLHTGRLQK